MHTHAIILSASSATISRKISHNSSSQGIRPHSNNRTWNCLVYTCKNFKYIVLVTRAYIFCALLVMGQWTTGTRWQDVMGQQVIGNFAMSSST